MASHIPQDIVSIFHCSFHPTKGNIIDWSLKANEDLDLTHVEFSSLPSGLHLVEEDVVYFTKDEHQGVSVFRRRKTSEQGHRGFRLTALGILLAKSARPRPWRHVSALRALMHSMYRKIDARGVLEPVDADWDLARSFFEARKVQNSDLGGAGDWKGWSEELDGVDSDPTNPTTHLAHLLRILGLSTMTLYKHILGRRRILIYTLPPVEASCILCHVAADMCYEDQVDYEWRPDDGPPVGIDAGGSRTDGASLRLKGRCRESVKVLGMITLNDLDMLKNEATCRRGWIACTTDAIFLEKASYFDLVIDLTTCTPAKASRPTLYLSKPIEPRPARGVTHRLSSVRFTWSDVKLWAELERLLHRDSDDSHCCEPSSKSYLQPGGWPDVWRLYEDVCIVCAGLWMGTWRDNSVRSYSTVDGNMANWGRVRLDGDDDLSVGGYVRNLGMGIEGRPVDLDSQITTSASTSTAVGTTTKAGKRASGISMWSRFTARESDDVPTAPPATIAYAAPSVQDPEPDDDPAKSRLDAGARERQVLTTLALLQTFHAHTTYIVSRLAVFLPPVSPSPASGGVFVPGSTVVLTPKDLLTFELGPLSGLDARFVEWIGDEYGERVGVRIVVRRGWRDLVGLVLGLG